MNPDELGEEFSAQVNVKMTKELRRGLAEIKKASGIEPTELLRRLGAAAVEYFREHGSFTLPAVVRPELAPTESKETLAPSAAQMLRELHKAVMRDERWAQMALRGDPRLNEEQTRYVTRQLAKGGKRRPA